jgi:Thioredoxin.
MKVDAKIKIVVIFLIAVCFFGIDKSEAESGCGSGLCGSFGAAKSNSTANQSDLPTGDIQVTFIELGSVNCMPCKQMKSVMNAIEVEYAGKVKVVFHDVWTAEGKPYGEQYGIRVIPTQVFIDKNGKEVFRHEGYLSKESVEKVLRDAGVQK